MNPFKFESDLFWAIVKCLLEPKTSIYISAVSKSEAKNIMNITKENIKKATDFCFSKTNYSQKNKFRIVFKNGSGIKIIPNTSINNHSYMDEFPTNKEELNKIISPFMILNNTIPTDNKQVYLVSGGTNDYIKQGRD